MGKPTTYQIRVVGFPILEVETHRGGFSWWVSTWTTLTVHAVYTKPFLQWSMFKLKFFKLCHCNPMCSNFQIFGYRFARVLKIVVSISDMHSCIFSHIWSHAIYSEEVTTNRSQHKRTGQYGILHMCTVSNQHFNRRSILKTPRGSKSWKGKPPTARLLAPHT